VPTAVPSPRPVDRQDAVATIVAQGEADLYATYPSPDGAWRVDVLDYPCRSMAEPPFSERQRVEQLILVDATTEAQQVIGSQLLTCDGGVGAFGFDGYAWSPDSHLFYYTDAREGVPDGGGGVCWDRYLWVLRVEDGATERLADVWARPNDGDRLAWVDGGDIVVQTWNGDQLARMSIRDTGTEICEITWSPEGAVLVALLVPDLFSPGTVTTLCIDVASVTLTPLLQLEDAAAPSVSWDASQGPVVTAYQDGERRTWRVEEPYPALSSLGAIDPVPDDVSARDIYRLPDLGLTLPVPPDWIVAEQPAMLSLRSSVGFQPPLWTSPSECGYQCPSISLVVYDEGLDNGADNGAVSIAALQAWLDARSTPRPFGSTVETDTVIYYGVTETEPTTFGGRPALGFIHDAMGIRIYTTLTAVEDVAIALSETHVGQFDFSPVYEIMRTRTLF
jgi:hypothetical protein